MNEDLDGGFKYFLFSSLLGEDSHFDSYFSTGLKPPTRDVFHIRTFEGDETSFSPY